MYMIEYTKQTMYWKRKVIANRANCVDTGNNGKIESFRKYTMGICVMNGRIMVLFILLEKYTMGFSKQMCHDGKGIMLTLIDSLGHNPC